MTEASDVKGSLLFICFLEYIFTLGTGRCNAGWDLFSDYCYYISQTRLTWDEANTQCKAQGSQLVSVHNSDEQSFLTSKL